MENGAERSSVRSRQRRRAPAERTSESAKEKRRASGSKLVHGCANCVFFPLVVGEHRWARHIARPRREPRSFDRGGRHGSTGAVQWSRHCVPRRRLPSHGHVAIPSPSCRGTSPSRPLAIGSWVEFHGREPLEVENEPLTIQLSDGGGSRSASSTSAKRPRIVTRSSRTGGLSDAPMRLAPRGY